MPPAGQAAGSPGFGLSFKRKRRRRVAASPLKPLVKALKFLVEERHAHEPPRERATRKGKRAG